MYCLGHWRAVEFVGRRWPSGGRLGRIRLATEARSGLDPGGAAGGIWTGLAVLLQALDVEADGVADFRLDLLDGLRGGGNRMETMHRTQYTRLGGSLI